MKIEITPAEMQEAISEGVRRAIVDLAGAEGLLEAIRQGSEEGTYRFCMAIDAEDNEKTPTP